MYSLMNSLEKKEYINEKNSVWNREEFDDKWYSEKINEISKEKEKNKRNQEEDAKALYSSLEENGDLWSDSENTKISKKKDLPAKSKKNKFRNKVKNFFWWNQSRRSKNKDEKWRPGKLDESDRWKDNSDRGGHWWGNENRQNWWWNWRWKDKQEKENTKVYSSKDTLLNKRAELLKAKRDLSLLSDYQKYEKIFDEIVEKLIKKELIRDEKYYKAVGRWFKNSRNMRKGESVIVLFAYLLDKKGYDLEIIDQDQFTNKVKWAGEYCKLKNRKTWEEGKIIIWPYIEPISCW